MNHPLYFSNHPLYFVTRAEEHCPAPSAYVDVACFRHCATAADARAVDVDGGLEWCAWWILLGLPGHLLTHVCTPTFVITHADALLTILPFPFRTRALQASGCRLMGLLANDAEVKKARG